MLSRSSDAGGGRRVLVAVDLSDQSLKALQWTAFEFVRRGDIVHLIHVARVMSPQYTIQHSYPGASYTIPDPNALDENQYVEHVRDIIKSRFTSILDSRKIQHSLHLFLDTDNAPASAVCASIFKVAEDINACMLVMACHNKAYGWDTMFLGSVADYATQNSKLPVMIIRDYKPPLVISVSSTPKTGPSPVVSPRPSGTT
mmetsp:Transcript_14905/g.32317  ORF Transcript_14905/g.32317 Transcript_14905/m.32317 type:complete len:200 (+) Transcript_14905:76-675(+)